MIQTHESWRPVLIQPPKASMIHMMVVRSLTSKSPNTARPCGAHGVLASARSNVGRRSGGRLGAVEGRGCYGGRIGRIGAIGACLSVLHVCQTHTSQDCRRPSQNSESTRPTRPRVRERQFAGHAGAPVKSRSGRAKTERSWSVGNRGDRCQAAAGGKGEGPPPLVWAKTANLRRPLTETNSHCGTA